MEMCYNHVFIYAEFEIINMFFKEIRSKYKPAYVLNTHNFFYIFRVDTEISVWSWKFGLKSWKSPGNPLVKMCKNPVIERVQHSSLCVFQVQSRGLRGFL